jgi:hypothetical protein
VRWQLTRGGIDVVSLAPPPRLAGDDPRIVLAVLRRVGASCLERSLVLQYWYASHGICRSLVIGVTAPSSGFRAHAWLEGDCDPVQGTMVEILRRAPSAQWLSAAAHNRWIRL